MKYLLPVLLGFTLMLAWQGTVRGHTEHAQYLEWMQSLRNNAGVSCCDGHDSKEVEDWEPQPYGAYHIRVEGVWFDVAASQVVGGPNRIGSPQAWIGQRGQDGAPYVRCFLPGALI